MRIGLCICDHFVMVFRGWTRGVSSLHNINGSEKANDLKRGVVEISRSLSKNTLEV